MEEKRLNIVENELLAALSELLEISKLRSQDNRKVLQIYASVAEALFQIQKLFKKKDNENESN